MNRSYHTYYDVSQKTWWAHWVDEDGHKWGLAVSGPTKEWALIRLGLWGWQD